jgi:hypothetical protein
MYKTLYTLHTNIEFKGDNMKRRNTRYFVVGLIAFTLILTGAYAILTATLNISGTATGVGNFKLEFTNVSVSDATKATTTNNADNTTITIDTNLNYPGDSVTTNFTIKNTGGLDARVDSITVNNPDSNDFTVQIIGLSTIEGTTLPVGGATDSSIIITWKSTSTTPTPEGTSFDISINFSQATT